MFCDPCGTNNSKICRICLKSSDNPVHIFGDYCIQNFRSLKECMEEICEISVSVEDNLPESLCQKCTEQIEDSYTFRLLAQRNDEFLHKILEGDYIEETKPLTNEDAEDVENKSITAPMEDDLPSDNDKNCRDRVSDTLGQADDHESIHEDFSDLIEVVGSEEDEVNDKEDTFAGHYDDQSDENTLETPQRTADDKLSKTPPLKPQEKSFECDYCEAKFVYLKNKRQHEKRHTREGNRICVICDRRFYTNYDLNRHLYAHRNEKQFKCEVCEKLFLTKSELNRHQKIHDSFKQYKCELCGKDFHELGVLNFHTKTVHLDQKKHQCVNCGKFFSTPSKVRRHQKTKVCLQTRSVATLHVEDKFIIVDASECLQDSDSVNNQDRKDDDWITVMDDEYL